MRLAEIIAPFSLAIDLDIGQADPLLYHGMLTDLRELHGRILAKGFAGDEPKHDTRKTHRPPQREW